MSAHPVDSTYYHCCKAIGRHTPDCTTTATQIPLPEGAQRADDWTEDNGIVGRFVHWPNIGGLPDGLEVARMGFQLPDGAVIREHVCLSGDVTLTPGGWHQTVAALSNTLGS